MKKPALLASATFVVGILLGILLGQRKGLDIITTSSNLTFSGPGTQPLLAPLALSLESNDKLIFAAIGGGPGGAKPTAVGTLPGTHVWQTMPPGAAANTAEYQFSQQSLANQVQGEGYSLIVLAGYSQPGFLGLWQNITFEARLFWFEPAEATGAKEIRFGNSELLEPH